ncbi:TPM domain-containing protein [Arenibacter amylolyticus]|uniref:TPM domain-containing protein n=1 Tax=Arenibacter amylolyticus TaxID=1406873 RepID=UPI000A3B8629|nr:TPM domain-containing protein [Arenibacter amylolyticus]
MFKRILLFWILTACTTSIFAQFNIPEPPKTPTSVYDYAKMLSTTEEHALKTKLLAYADTTSTQIVIAIVPTINGENIGLLTPKWAHEWGIGQADKDNGVFILLAEKERRIWISPGYGVEDRLTAGIVGEITRNVIIPEFKENDYYAGLNKGIDAIIQVLNGKYKEDRTFGQSNDLPFSSILPIIIFIIIMIILSNRGRRGGNSGSGGGRSGGLDIWDIIVLSNMGRSGHRTGSSGGGFGSGGGFSGGFGGGFGGGGFSGGGAGGSW